MAVNLSVPVLNWDNPDQAKAFKMWKQAMTSYLIIKDIAVIKQYHVIYLSATSGNEQFHELWENWNLSEADLKDPSKVFRKFERHLVGEVNKWVSRHDFLEMKQGETETVSEYVSRLRAQATKCKFQAGGEDDWITYQIIRGVKWAETKRELISKGNDLKLSKAIEIAESYQATEANFSNLERPSINAVKKSDTSQQQQRGPCRFCGTLHPPKKCPAWKKKCKKCGNINHWEKVCENFNKKEKSQTQTQLNKKSSNSNKKKKSIHSSKLDEPEGVYVDDTPLECGSVECTPNVGAITNSDGERQVIMAKLDIKPPNVKRKVKLTVKADTGASGNILPIRVMRQMYPSEQGNFKGLLKPSLVTLTAVNDLKLHNYGTIRMPTSLDGSKILDLLYYVCETQGPALLSCDASEKLGIISVGKSRNISSVKSKCIVQSTVPISDIYTMKHLYPKCFGNIGEMKGQYHISLKTDAEPVVVPPRKYPIQLKEEIVKKLEELEKIKVITKCPDDESSEWIQALAFTRKASGELRICLDPKPLNKAIKRTYHKIPTLDEIAYKLEGSTIYSKLDAKNGYWSVVLDEESSKLCTFHSPAGKYRFLRLPFGLSVSQDIFQSRMDKILAKVGEGVIGIADDVVVYGKSLEEHDKALHRLLNVAQQEGLVFRLEKCHIRQSCINFFGLMWSKDGKQPEQKKCDDIHNRPPPENVQELQSFLGLVQYMSPFIPKLSDKTKILRQLLKKGIPFEWSIDHQNAFEELKQHVSVDTKLRYFDTQSPVTLEVDASLQGLGAALIQNGKPVAFASKTLSPCETRYANIERELLSVVFALEYFHCFIFGKPVTVISDHKPLENIHLKQLSQAPPRLQRMLLRIQPYDVDLKYKPGKDMIFADYLSRIKPSPGPEVTLEHAIHLIQISKNQLNRVKEATNSDENFCSLREQIISGWPESSQVVPKSIRHYYSMKDFLTIEDGVIFYGERLLVPPSMKEEYLARIHEGHMGISKSQSRARECLYWNGMMKDITEYIGECRECLVNARSQSNEPMIAHSSPSYPWQLISTDLFELDGQQYLLVADNFSKMPFVKRLGHDTTTKAVTNFLEELFSIHGPCQVLYSDNGPQYSSVMFKNFVKNWDISHVTSSPRYPCSNGFIERMVGIVKGIIIKAKMSGTSVYKALLAYRACPLSNGMKSPAELLFKRKIACGLPVKIEATPNITDHHSKMLEASTKSKEYYDAHAQSPLSELLPGMKVLVQEDKIWNPAIVVRKEEEPRSYTLRTSNGSEIRRNRKVIKELSNNAAKKFNFLKKGRKTGGTTTKKSNHYNSRTTTRKSKSRNYSKSCS